MNACVFTYCIQIKMHVCRARATDLSWISQDAHCLLCVFINDKKKSDSKSRFICDNWFEKEKICKKKTSKKNFFVMKNVDFCWKFSKIRQFDDFQMKNSLSISHLFTSFLVQIYFLWRNWIQEKIGVRAVARALHAVENSENRDFWTFFMIIFTNMYARAPKMFWNADSL